MNNFYGWAMSDYLPYGGFKQLKNLDGFDVGSICEKGKIGYILEVDLELLEKLHLLHNDYSLVPEKHQISYDKLSDYCKKIADGYEIKVGEVKKLISNLGSKPNYVVYYRNLQLYLSLGNKLTKIHRVVKVKHCNWMKIYINFNTEKEQMLPIVLNKTFLH